MRTREWTRTTMTKALALLATAVLFATILVPIDQAVANRPAIQPLLAASQVRSDHPRLMIDQARFSSLRAQVANDSFSRSTYAAILANADALLTAPALVYEKPDGIRLLSTSRELVDRAYTLGFAWQMSSDARYAERLWQDLDAVTRFPDWSPNHFLDTAEMTHGVAIGYDWLFSYWNGSRRAQLSTAIADLGLRPSQPVYDAPADSAGPYTQGGNWSQNTNNWNVVVNSAMAVGAIAIAQDDPSLSETILSASLTSVRRGISAYANGGGYVEGLSYWDYATRYLVVLLQSLRASAADEAGLAGLPGLSDTGYFPIYLTAPTGNRFNFGDSEAGVSRGPVLAGLGDLYGDPSATYAGITEGKGGSAVQRLLWYSPSRASSSPSTKGLPLDRNFENARVAGFRSAWNDPNATFVGFRTGSSPDAGHQQLDAGSFNLDALGQNWATELGKDDYGLAGYFDQGAAGARWDYYRLRAEGQNTLVINPYSASPTKLASTPAARFESNTVSAFSVADLSVLYPDAVTSWKRGVKLLDGRQQVLVQDEIRSSKPVQAVWSMHTAATIKVSSDGRSATLTLNGKQLLARIVSQSASARFADAAAAPLPSSPHPAEQNANTGIRKLSIDVSTSGNTTLAVQFTPLASSLAAPAAPGIVALDSWTLEKEGSSRASGIRVNGASIPGFSPSVYRYTVRSDPSSAVPTVQAVKSGATVTSTLPSAIPGIATTTITEPGKTPTTYRVLIDRGPMAIGSSTATRTTAGSPAATYDGNLATYWSTWQDNSITYTLAQARSIKSVVIDWRANASRHTKFELQTSWNGSTWTTRYDGAYDGSSGPQLIVPTTSASSKFVRIVGHGDQGPDPRTSIAEVTLFGYDSSPPKSEPDPTRLGSVAVAGVPTSMEKGQSAALTFSAATASGRAIAASSVTAVRYVSGDPSVASISDAGAVTAVKAGTTSIGVIVTVGGVTETAYVAVAVTDPLRLRIYASGDAYVRGGATADTNYGTATQLAVKPANPGSTDESYTRAAYMSFDLTQLRGKQVASAILSMNAAVTEPSGSAARLDLHAVEGAWAESSLTFRNRPAFGATVGSAAVDVAFAYKTSDITNYVKSRVAASAGALSLGVTQDTPFVGGSPLITQVKSRESSSPPYIDIVLKPAS